MGRFNLRFSRNVTTTLLFALLCVIWSTTWVAIRVCDQGFPPLWAAAMRFLLSAFVLLAVSRRGLPRPPIAPWILPLAGLANAVSYGLLFVAEREITGGMAAVLAATNPFFLLGVAVTFGYERASIRKVLGLTVGIVGVALLVGSGVSVGQTRVIAMLEVLLPAAILWPTYTILMRRAVDGGWTPSQVTLSFVLWTTAFLVPGALLFEGRPPHASTPAAIGALVYLALVGTVIAWSLYIYLLRRLQMTVLSTLLFIEPAGALSIDWLLGERTPDRFAWLGAVMILVGVLFSAVGRAGTEIAGPAP